MALQAQREAQRADARANRLGRTQERQGRRLLLPIDRAGAVVTGRLGGLSPVSPSVEMVVGVEETSCGSRLAISRALREARGVTTQSGCAVKASWRNVARPERMQGRSEPLELSCADHAAG